MNTTPQPEEEREALRAADEQRTRAATAVGWPRWTWIAAGVLAVAYGILIDQAPGLPRTGGSILVILLLVAALAVNTRGGGVLADRSGRPRVLADRTSVLWSALVLIVLIAGGALIAALHVPHAAIWIGLAGGLLLAGAGQWWQRRVLSRGAAR